MFKLDLRAEARARLSEREFLEAWASRIFLMSEREFFLTIISEPERAKLVIGIVFYKSLRKWYTNVIKLQLSFKNETNRWKWKIRVTFKFGTGRTTCSTWTRTGCHCVLVFIFIYSSMSLPLIHRVTSVFYIFYAYIIWILNNKAPRNRIFDGIVKNWKWKGILWTKMLVRGHLN